MAYIWHGMDTVKVSLNDYVVQLATDNQKVYTNNAFEPYAPLPISRCTHLYDQQYLLWYTGPISGTQFGHASSKMFASPALGRTSLQIIALKWRRIISFPETPTCLFPVDAGGNQRKETVTKRTFVIRVFTSIIAAFHFTRAIGGHKHRRTR
jgi:hypothetical protein